MVLAGAAAVACGDGTSPLTNAQRAASPDLGTLEIGETRVLTLEQAWGILLQREEGSGAMPAEARGPTRELLLEFGYVEYLITPVGGRDRRALWIRPDWLAETIEEVPLP